MDIYFEIKEIKERQERILAGLDALIQEKSLVRLYDLEDITRVLKVSRRTVFTWLKQGLLPHSKVGGKIWVSDEQLKLFLENHSNEPNVSEIIGKGRIKYEG